MKRHFAFVCFTLFFTTIMFSQKGAVKGTVLDKDTGEPIIFGNVILEGTTYGANTDYDGHFVIAKVPDGEYKLIATYIGYDSVAQEVKVIGGRPTISNLYMSSSGVNLAEINISAERQQARTEVQISKVSVSRKQIKALPSTGGDADIVQYLQVLPGVISTGDQGGQLYIRGGSPVQNRISLDGVTIYNPFHSIGFYSIFETELIKNVDVLTGGFDARYGNRISAIVDIKTRDGNKKRISGQVSGSPFMIKGLVEGPIVPFREGKSSASFAITHKESIIDKTALDLYPHASVNDSIGLPFTFSDTYGKISFAAGSGSKITLFGFNFNDRYNNPLVADVDWKNTGGGLNLHLIPSGVNMILDGSIGVSRYNIGIREADGSPRSSAIDELTAKFDFTVFGDQSELRYGFEINSVRTDFNFTNPFKQILNQFQNTTQFAAYAKFRKIFGKLIIDPSVRYQFYASQSQSSIEPRLGLKFNASDKLRFKLAGGLYSQNILSTSNERDVVNIFTGFLTSPEGQIVGLDGAFVEKKLQTARHAIVGFEYDFNPRLLFNVEGYFKDSPQLIIVNRNKVRSSDPDYATEEGEAYGIDFTAKYETPKMYLWLTYSMGFVNRFDGEQEYPTIFDRRHNANVLLTYNLDDKGDWSVSARWNLGSGFPFTKTQGFYNDNKFLGGPETDVLTSNPDEIGILYASDRNGGRLPYYHRLDLSMTRIFRFSKYFNLETVVGVSNVYDRENIFFFDRIRYERVNQLPIIPSAGLKLNF